MKTKLCIVLAALAALMVPAIASADWVGRSMPANGLTYAIHYNMPTVSFSSCYSADNYHGVCGGIEVFSSVGGSYAVPYRVSLMGENTGKVYCDSPIGGSFGQHWLYPASAGCGFNVQYYPTGKKFLAFPEPMRCRVTVPNRAGQPTVGYYCREVAIEKTW